MKKNCFIVLSCIDSKNGSLSPEEKDRQVGYTIVNCKNSDNDADIFLVDSSVNSDYYRIRYTNDFLLSFIQNLKYYNVGDYDPPLTRQVVHESTDKKFTESFALRNFLLNKFEELKEYKFITVCSSMYICNFNVKEYVDNKIYFKRQPSKKFPENETEYSYLDTRKYNNDDLIHSYCSHAYSFDSVYLQDFLYVHEYVMQICRRGHIEPTLEECLYSFTRHLRENIIEIDWNIDGFDDNGSWYRY